MFYFVCLLIFVKQSYLSIQTVKFFARRGTVSNLRPHWLPVKIRKCYSWNVQCSPQTSVWAFNPQLIVLFGKIVGSLKQVARLAMVSQWGLTFRVRPSSLSLAHTLFFPASGPQVLPRQTKPPQPSCHPYHSLSPLNCELSCHGICHGDEEGEKYR